MKGKKPPLPANGIMADVLKELARAKAKFPRWPDHIVARGAIVAEEAGELLRECLHNKYEGENNIEAMRKEAIQVIVTGIRFLENLK